MVPLIVSQLVAPPQASLQSPLQIEEKALSKSVSDVQWEFVRQVVLNFVTSQQNFRHIPEADRKAYVKQAYYLQALSMIGLTTRGDPELIQLLSGVTPKTVNNAIEMERIALSFESTYRRKYGLWPQIVPVNVEALTERMLRQRVVR